MKTVSADVDSTTPMSLVCGQSLPFFTRDHRELFQRGIRWTMLRPTKNRASEKPT
jgi:hypothetical protein